LSFDPIAQSCVECGFGFNYGQAGNVSLQYIASWPSRVADNLTVATPIIGYPQQQDNDRLYLGPQTDGVIGTVVPLPASAWLMLSGLVGVGAMARKRRVA
jgi:hypothetical protein